MTNFKLGENHTAERNICDTCSWHTASDDNCLRLATPPGYAIVDVAHTPSPVAVVFRQSWKAATLTIPVCSTFEAIAVQPIQASSSSSICTVVGFRTRCWFTVMRSSVMASQPRHSYRGSLVVPLFRIRMSTVIASAECYENKLFFNQ